MEFKAIEVCVFCYKTSERTDTIFYKKLTSGSVNDLVNEFIKYLERFSSCCTEQELTTSSNQNISETGLNTTRCCNICAIIVKDFCDDYHKMKCLEMKMEWTLQRLVGIMDLAGRVPSRWFKLKQAFGQSENDLKTLKCYRQTIIKTCKKRFSRSQPRVLLNRYVNADQFTRHVDRINIGLSGAECENPLEPEGISEVVNIIKCEEKISENLDDGQIQICGNPLMISSDTEIEETSKPGNIHFMAHGQVDVELDPENCHSDEETVHLEQLSQFTKQAEEAKKDPLKFYDCPECGKQFRHQWRIKYHLITHQKKKRLQCQYCIRRYPHSQALLDHVKRMHKDKIPPVEKSIPKAVKPAKLMPPECQFCGEQFPSRARLGIHVRKDHVNKGDVGDLKLIQCSQCDRKFLTQRLLRAHIKTVHSSAKFRCTKCGKCFKLIKSLRLHEALHEEKKIKCGECGKMFFRKQDLTNHNKAEHHKNEGPIICQSSTVNNISLGHDQTVRDITDDLSKYVTPENEFIEEIQETEVKVSQNLPSANVCKGEQETTVTCVVEIGQFGLYKVKEEPNSELSEDKAVLSKDNLRDHNVDTNKLEEGTHTETTSAGESSVVRNSPDSGQNFQCDKCPKSFGTKPRLRSHKMHMHSIHRCKICGEEFKNDFQKRKHAIIVHNRPAPVPSSECNQCGKKFFGKFHLELHIARHHEGKVVKRPTKLVPKEEYRCTECGKMWSCQSDLTYHTFTHYKGEPVICQFCEGAFPHSRALQRHIRSNHRVEMDNVKKKATDQEADI